MVFHRLKTIDNCIGLTCQERTETIYQSTPQQLDDPLPLTHTTITLLSKNNIIICGIR